MLIRSTGNPEIDAFIEFEVRYNQTRWAEVWLAMAMTLTGIVFLRDGDTFSLSRGYDFIAAFVSEDTAGWLGLIVGVCRMAALAINGRIKRSPFFRCIGSALGALFWGGMWIGFVLVTDSQAYPLVVATGFTFLCAELHSSGRSARDAFAYMRYKRSGAGKSNARFIPSASRFA